MVKLSVAAAAAFVAPVAVVLDVITCEEPSLVRVSPSDRIIFNSPVSVFGNKEPTVKLTGSDILILDLFSILACFLAVPSPVLLILR